MQEPIKRFRGEIRPLTGLRGIAAVAVVLYHFVNMANGFGAQNLFGVPNGYLAVDLFFVLSGFVLSYNYTKTFSSGVTQLNYRDFIFKRIARIYPPYLCLMFLYYLKMAINFSGDRALERLTVGDYVGNLFLATGWGMNVYPLIGPSWSVSAEMFCYFIFPFIVWSCFRRPVAIGLIVLAASITLLGLGHFGIGAKGPLDLVRADTLEALCRAAAGFSIGIACYWIYARIDLSAHQGAGTAVTGTFYVVVVTAWIMFDSEIVRYICLVMVVLVASTDDRVSRLLFSNSFVYYLGQISYSIYLVHVLFLSVTVRLIEMMARNMPFEAAYILGLGIYLAIVLGVSHFSYHVFEMRGRRVFMSLSRRQLRST